GRVVARPATVAEFGAAPVRVQLLGPIEVQVGEVEAGTVEDDRRRRLSEIVVMASLHPDGVHEAVLRSSLWPRGVGDDVIRARLEEVQAWLGVGADGAPLLAVAHDGRIRLSAQVASDYGVLRVAAGHRGPGELGELIGALRMATGEAFSGDGSHYHWMTFAREARKCRLLCASAARRAAELATAQGDTQLAVEALDLGLLLVPTADELWRRLLRLRATHSPSMVDQTIDKMYSAMLGRGVPEEPETAALIEQLRPDRERAVGI
ncbi:MAG: hypothetical protein ACRCYU_14615, partial [Nocardioides sp.]